MILMHSRYDEDSLSYAYLEVSPTVFFLRVSKGIQGYGEAWYSLSIIRILGKTGEP